MIRKDQATSAAAAPAASESVLAGVRGWLLDGAELLRVRVALLGTEAAEHALDLARALFWATVAAWLLAMGVGFVAVLLTVLLWDSHRLLALAVLAVLLLALGGVAAVVARRTLAAIQWFEASRTELARDVDRLRHGSP
jgi:uncharacterized membrane protein YqjE